ncbi:hypothetical protein [Allomuricauda sp. d1]|uniref:hypothetical protein n=1 Tax=Allomuricauda sp. d1 TaxID=3136725 RepID=UPI0031D89CB7
MKILKIWASSVLLLSSCTTSDTENVEVENRLDTLQEELSNPDDDIIVESFNLHKNSSIALDDYGFAYITTGKKLVFEYSYYLDPAPSWVDDENTEIIVFEVDPALENFVFQNSDLISSSTFFTNLCFCIVDKSIAIENGKIQGLNVGTDVWELDINVNFEEFNYSTEKFEERNITITGLFSLEN